MDTQKTEINGKTFVFHGLNAFDRIRLSTMLSTDVLAPLTDALQGKEELDTATLMQSILRTAKTETVEKLTNKALETGKIFAGDDNPQPIKSIATLESAVGNSPIDFIEVIVRFYIFQLGDLIKEAQNRFSPLLESVQA